MENTQYTVQILKASEGKYLTNADNNIEISSRTMAKEIWLSPTDSAANYIEITEEQYNIYKEEQDKLLLNNLK